MSVQQQIEQKLRDRLAPERLSVVNESRMHNVPPGSESHFNAIIVSQHFEGLTLLRRHRAVYAALDDELRDKIHALTMKTMTPAEWEAAGGEAQNPAPPCRGGGSGR